MTQLDDRRTVKEFFHRKPFLERWTPVAQQLMSSFTSQNASNQQTERLPDYCHNILSVYRRTYFKGLPTIAETVRVIDKGNLARAKSIAEAKQVLEIDWRSMGKIIGIFSRSLRFFDLETEQMLENDRLLNLSPKKQKEVGEILLGKRRLQALKKLEKSDLVRASFKKINGERMNELDKMFADISPMWARLAYQWSPEAMAEFSEGIAEGQRSFLDKDGQLVGESNRANIYNFLLMAWPEIKEMLEAKPKKTLSDLYLWMQPFMREGLVSSINIEALRDVCAPPASGIGLSLRPLKTRRQKSSA